MVLWMVLCTKCNQWSSRISVIVAGVCSFSSIGAKFYWAPDFVEFVLGRFSHFYIAIAYSNSTFCGAWTPSFCEFTWKLLKFQRNEHTPEPGVHTMVEKQSLFHREEDLI